MELNYFSIWSAFTDAFLTDFTEDQVMKVFGQFTKEPKVDLNEAFVKWIKKTHLIRNFFKITFQSEINSLTLTD